MRRFIGDQVKNIIRIHGVPLRFGANAAAGIKPKLAKSLHSGLARPMTSLPASRSQFVEFFDSGQCARSPVSLHVATGRRSPTEAIAHKS